MRKAKIEVFETIHWTTRTHFIKALHWQERLGDGIYSVLNSLKEDGMMETDGKSTKPHHQGWRLSEKGLRIWQRMESKRKKETPHV